VRVITTPSNKTLCYCRESAMHPGPCPDQDPRPGPNSILCLNPTRTPTGRHGAFSAIAERLDYSILLVNTRKAATSNVTYTISDITSGTKSISCCLAVKKSKFRLRVSSENMWQFLRRFVAPVPCICIVCICICTKNQHTRYASIKI